MVYLYQRLKMKKILYLLILLVPLLMIAGERCVFSADVDKAAVSPVGAPEPWDTPEPWDKGGGPDGRPPGIPPKGGGPVGRPPGIPPGEVPLNVNVQPGDVLLSGTFPAFTAALEEKLI